MGQIKNIEVEFPSVVRELLSLRIKDEELVNPVFEYTITDSEKKVCRKGKFNGLEVQMRVAHLNSGKYYFTLNVTNNGESLVYAFEKKPRAGDILEFMAS